MWKFLQLFIFSWTSSININIKGAKGNHATIHMLHVRDQYYTEFWINESGDVWGVCLRLSSASHLHSSHPLFMEWFTYAHSNPPSTQSTPSPMHPHPPCLLSLPERLVVTTGKVTRSSGRVQTETPLASLSLSSPHLSRHMEISHGFLLTWDQPGSSKPPGMAVVILSPVPRALCLIKWAAVSTFDIGLTYV